MVSHRKTLQHSSFAASATLLLTLGLLATPAIAATSAQIPCEESTAPTLSVEINELVSTAVSHNASATTESSSAERSQSLLAPRARAAIRDAFEKNDAITASPASIDLSNATLRTPLVGKSSESEATEEEEKDADQDPGMNTKLPGISDEDSLRYKKQMYRRDI